MYRLIQKYLHNHRDTEAQSLSKIMGAQEVNTPQVCLTCSLIQLNEVREEESE